MKKRFNLYLKWLKMLLGKSNLHVNQGLFKKRYKRIL